MELKTFRKTFNDSLILKDFKRDGNYYCLFLDDILIVIGLQKSNYSNAYYINIGYIISQLNPFLEKPRDVDGDVRVRFGFDQNGKETDFFDLDEYSEDDVPVLKRQIDENIANYVDPVTSLDKLKDLLQRNPVLLFKTKLIAKELLGFKIV